MTMSHDEVREAFAMMIIPHESSPKLACQVTDGLFVDELVEGSRVVIFYWSDMTDDFSEFSESFFSFNKLLCINLTKLINKQKTKNPKNEPAEKRGDLLKEAWTADGQKCGA